MSGSGEVIEYALSGVSRQDWKEVVDHTALQQESEVVVYNRECLVALALWADICLNLRLTRCLSCSLNGSGISSAGTV